MRRIAGSLALVALLWPASAAHSALGAPSATALAAAHTSYELRVKIDPEHHNLHVEGRMTIPAPLPQPLRIALSRSFPQPDLHIVDQDRIATTPVRLKQAWQSDQATAWELQLDAPRTDRSLVLAFSYDGGSKPGRIFAVAPAESYADGSSDPWYPQVRASDRESDVPNVTGVVNYEYSTGPALISSGRLITTSLKRVAGDDDYYIQEYRVDRPQPISFALGTFSLAHSKTVPQFELNYTTKRVDLDVRRDWVRAVLDRYVRWYGPFPHEAWRLVEVPVFSWGNDVDDLVPYGASLIDDWNDANFAHELSHPYWGGDYLANEGMATFAALETFEASQGAAAAERFRRTGAPGYFENASGLGYLKIAAAGFDSPLGVPAGTNGPAQNIDFGKGMFALDMLARTVGRDKFHAFLRTYWADQRAQEFKTFSWPGFFAALSKSTGRDMQYFYDEWFARGGAPEWTFAWHNDNRVVVGEVVQRGTPYSFDLPLEGRDQDGKLYATVMHVSGSRSTLRWALPAVMREVKDDPHYAILHWTPEYRTLATALVPFTRWNYKRYDGVDADLAASLAAVPKDDAFGTRFAIEYGWARIHIARGNWLEAQRLLNAALAEKVVRPESVPWAYIRLAQVEGELKNPPAQREALQHALAAARKYSDEAAAARATRQFAALN
jgi:hypothetical protein